MKKKKTNLDWAIAQPRLALATPYSLCSLSVFAS